MPSRMLGLAGVTQIDWRTAGLTVSDVEPVTPSNVALIDEVPVASAGATPIDPAAFEIVAVAVFAEAHVTSLREVFRRVVGKRASGRELLGFPLGKAGIGRRDCDRFQHRE